MSLAGSEAVGQRAFSSLVWLLAQRWGTRISGLVTLGILARMLDPAEFGLVAAAMVFVPMLTLLTDLGFTEYLVQAERVDRRTLSTALWLSIAFGALLCVFFWLAAPLIAGVYSLPDVEPILRALAAVAPIAAFSGVPMAILRRDLKFKAIAAIAFVATLLGQAGAIVLAISDAGVWALVGQQLVVSATMLIGLWIAARWWPSLAFEMQRAREMISFGWRVVSADGLGLLRGWAESTIIVTTLGVSALGIWNMAQRLVQTVTDASAAAVVTVSASVFARVKGSKERLTRGYLRSLGATLTVVVPVMLFLAVASPTLVPLIFGEGWEAAVPVAQFSAVAAILVLQANLDRGLLTGSGSPGVWLAYAIVVDAATLVSTAIAAHYGLVWVAAGFLAVALLATVARSWLVGWVTDCTPGSVMRVVGPVVAAGGIAALIAGLVEEVTRGLPDIVALGLVGLTLVSFYLLAMRVMASEQLTNVLSVLPDRVQSVRPVAAILGGLSDAPAVKTLPDVTIEGSSS